MRNRDIRHNMSPTGILFVLSLCVAFSVGDVAFRFTEDLVRQTQDEIRTHHWSNYSMKGAHHFNKACHNMTINGLDQIKFQGNGEQKLKGHKFTLKFPLLVTDLLIKSDCG